MAKYRQLDTRFWKDSWVKKLKSNEKYLYLYFLTNSFTNIIGVYEIDLDEIVMDTGLLDWQIKSIINKLHKEGKIVYRNNWIVLKNFIKYQSKSESVVRGMWKEFEQIPESIKKEIIGQIPEDKRNKASTTKRKRTTNALKYIPENTKKPTVDRDQARKDILKFKKK